MSQPRGVKPSKLAKTLGVSRVTVWRWIKANRIQAISYGPKTTIIPYPVYRDIVAHGLPAEY